MAVETMNFNRMRAAVLVVMSSALLACEESRAKERGRLAVKVRKLEAKIAEIDTEFREVKVAVSKLGFEIEDFGTENWKTNVPDVEYQFEQLQRSVSEMGGAF